MYINKKLAYTYEHFNSNKGCQNSVDNVKKEDFFSYLKTKCPSDEEIERTKENKDLFIIKNRKELTQLYLKSDVLFLACVLENFMEVSVNEFEINPLHCVSLPSYTWQGGLNYTRTNLQTFQDKLLILLLENIIRGGISYVMGVRFVESDENKKKFIIDADNFYGHSISQSWPHDEIEMWHGHPNLYIINLREIVNAWDDSDFGYFFWS